MDNPVNGCKSYILWHFANSRVCKEWSCANGDRSWTASHSNKVRFFKEVSCDTGDRLLSEWQE